MIGSAWSSAVRMLCLSALLLAVSGTTAVAAPVLWQTSGRIDRAALTGVSCPSPTLCVAVDGVGRVLTSVDPTHASSWHPVDVDGTNAISGVSCPATSLCVAIDLSGDVITSTDPTGGAGAWTVANVNAGAPLTHVSCASVALCAATGVTILVSADPAEGAGAWSNTGVGGGTYYECVHYGGTEPSCDAPPTGISCVTGPLLCVGSNDAGAAIASTDPTGTASEWVGSGPENAEYLALSCASSTLCVATCPVAVQAGEGECDGTDYENGEIVAWNPLSSAVGSTSVTVSRDPLTQIWCVSASACFATDGTAQAGLFSSPTGSGHLYLSTDPGAARPAWSFVDRDLAIAGVTCPTVTCIAVDTTGRVLTGSDAPVTTLIERALESRIAPAPRPTIRRLLSRGGYRFPFGAPTPGELTISWFAKPTRGAAQLAAEVSARFVAPGSRELTIRPSRAGRQLLGSRGRLTIMAVGRFARAGQPTTSEHASFQLRR